MASELKQRNKANKALASLPNFHPFIPVETINEALVAAGLRSMEPAIYCGREGRCVEQVGERSYVALSWYKMESGNYEIVVYVS